MEKIVNVFVEAHRGGPYYTFNLAETLRITKISLLSFGFRCTGDRPHSLHITLEQGKSTNTQIVTYNKNIMAGQFATIQTLMQTLTFNTLRDNDRNTIDLDITTNKLTFTFHDEEGEPLPENSWQASMQLLINVKP